MINNNLYTDFSNLSYTDFIYYSFAAIFIIYFSIKKVYMHIDKVNDIILIFILSNIGGA